MHELQSSFDRRQILRGAAMLGGTAALAAYFPAWAQPVSTGLTAPLVTVSGPDITLRIARQTMTIDGRASRAIGINGTVPAPLIRLLEGQTDARLRACRDLEVSWNRHVDTGGDYFDIGSQNSALSVIIDCYRQSGEGEKAARLQKELDRRQDRSVRRAL